MLFWSHSAIIINCWNENLKTLRFFRKKKKAPTYYLRFLVPHSILLRRKKSNHVPISVKRVTDISTLYLKIISFRRFVGFGCWLPSNCEVPEQMLWKSPKRVKLCHPNLCEFLCLPFFILSTKPQGEAGIISTWHLLHFHILEETRGRQISPSSSFFLSMGAPQKFLLSLAYQVECSLLFL